MSGVRLTHRWPRAHIGDADYGPSCECGAIKTDQALSCFDCAVKRRRAADYWERRTCRCGGRKTKDALVCRACRNKEMRGKSISSGRPQGDNHPWRKAESARLASIK